MINLPEHIEYSFEIKPLIDSITNKQAVIFVGAGASISAGLPDWKRFLSLCFERAKLSFDPDGNQPAKYTKKIGIAESLFKEGDYLLAAQLLYQAIDVNLLAYVEETYAKRLDPTSIHKSICRIPFSMAVTTNFDKLLETAYNNVINVVTSQKAPNVLTWKSKEAIITSIKHNTFSIIKSHGDAGQPDSIIFTRRSFDDLMKERAFNNGIATLLSLKSFVFVGSSLRDPDLLKLMNEARLTYQTQFGPHYAFLFDNEVDEPLAKYLKETYNINVIICKTTTDDSKEFKTNSVYDFLKWLSGMVAKNTKIDFKTNEINSFFFNFNELIRAQLKEILLITASESGSVSFIQSRDLPGLKFVFKCNFYNRREGEFESYIYDHSEYQNSVIGNLYLEGGDEILRKDRLVEKGIYIKSKLSKKYLKVNDDSKYIHVPVNPETQSVLATQIFSDGQPVGVIAIESTIKDAYTQDHFKTLRNATIPMGAVFKELELRDKILREVDLANRAVDLQEALDKCARLKPYGISYLFYEIDHRNGKLIAHYDQNTLNIDKPTSNTFEYSFTEESFVNYILKNQKDIYIDDVLESAKLHQIISRKGIEYFKIKGSLYGAPVRVGHYISFILVAWSREQRPLERVCQRICRLVQFITNSPDRNIINKILGEKDSAINFINQMNKALRKEGLTDLELRQDNLRMKHIETLIESLVNKNCDLGRVRLWFSVDNGNSFECIYSISQKTATVQGKESKNAYKGQKTDSNDPYCMYTRNRFQDNPYAMHQHKNMFPVEDINTQNLDKDPDGKWIVGPVVYYKKDVKSKSYNKVTPILLGYISADNHYPENDKIKERVFSERKDAFQRYAVDLVSDILKEVLYLHLNKVEEKI